MKHPSIPDHLWSGCADRPGQPGFICYGGCGQSVKQAPTGAYYVTMGHPGFNSPVNNHGGYKTLAAALATVAKYGGGKKN